MHRIRFMENNTGLKVTVEKKIYSSFQTLSSNIWGPSPISSQLPNPSIGLTVPLSPTALKPRPQR